MGDSGLRRRVCRRGNRGAVFLLSVYFIALTCLVLNSSSLQRAIMEMRAAELSRNIHQSFYLAEAGMDRALQAIRTGVPRITEGTPTTISPRPTESYAYTVRTRSNTIQLDGSRDVVRDLTATGWAGGRSTTVTTTLLSHETYSGILVNGGVEVWGRDWTADTGSIEIQGNVRSAAGQKLTIGLYDGTRVDGDVAVNVPSATNGYTILVSDNIRAKPGVLVESGFSSGLRDAKVTGSVEEKPLSPFPSVSPIDCAPRPFYLDEGERYDLRDGDPLDVSAFDAQGQPIKDGRVVLCLSTLNFDMDTQLIIHDPTIMYVVPGQVSRWNSTVFINDGIIKTVSALQTQPNLGLTVVIPKSTGPTRSQVEADLGNFMGSVYAPDALVFLGPSYREIAGCDNCNWGHPASRRQLGYLVAQEVQVEGTPLDFERRHSQQESILRTDSVVGWTGQTQH